MLLFAYTCWITSCDLNGIFRNRIKDFWFICSSEPIAERPEKGKVQTNVCKKKNQWLQKAKITVIYTHG